MMPPPGQSAWLWSYKTGKFPFPLPLPSLKAVQGGGLQGGSRGLACPHAMGAAPYPGIVM